MEIHLLKSFVAVAEEENLTRAATRLFSSQPAVSAHIKGLEDELGVKLFDRAAKGMVLTANGVHLLEKAERILSNLGEMNDLARELQSNPSGVLRVGINVDGSVLKLEEIASAFSEKYPSMSLEFVSGASGVIQRAIANGDLDIGFVEEAIDTPQYQILPIGDSIVVVVGAPEMAQQFETKSWEEMKDLPWLFNTPECSYHHLMERVSKAHGIEINKKYIIDHDVTSLQFVLKGAAISLFSKDLILEFINSGQLIVWKGWSGTLSRSLVCLSKRSKERAIHTFFELTQLNHQFSKQK